MLFIIALQMMPILPALFNRDSFSDVIETRLLEESDVETEIVDLHDYADENSTFVILENFQYFFVNKRKLLNKVIIDREYLCITRMCKCSMKNQRCFLNVAILIKPNGYVLKVKVEILDVNDNKPVFPRNEYYIEIPEHVSIGTRVPIDVAIDADTEKYSVKSYQMVYDGQYPFKAVMDESKMLYLEVISVIDRELIDRYSLVVFAFDGGGFNCSTKIFVSVTDINDNSPVFEKTNYTMNISENYDVDQILCVLKANDADIGLNGDVRFGLSNDTLTWVKELISIDIKTGEVRLRRKLDLRNKYIPDFLKTTVFARDNGPDSVPSFAFLSISFIDINNHKPVVEIKDKYLKHVDKIIKLEETNEIDALVAFVIATDFDRGRNAELKCKLLCIENGCDENFHLFEFRHGQWMLKAMVLDREVWESGTVGIEVSDNGIPQLSTTIVVTIELDDINDNAPVFRKMDTVNITTNVAPGSVIGRVQAIDFDKGMNSKIVYHLIPPCFPFSIDKKTGEIRLISSVARNRSNALILLKVKASDSGKRSLSSFMDVKIRVLKQHRIPLFAGSSQSFYVNAQDPIGTAVGKVDISMQNADSLEFALHPKTPFAEYYFAINETGTILTTQKLLPLKGKRVHLSLVAYENPMQQVYAEADVYIDVIGDNMTTCSLEYFPKKIVIKQKQMNAKGDTILGRGPANGRLLGNSKYFSLDKDGTLLSHEQPPVGRYNLKYNYHGCFYNVTVVVAPDNLHLKSKIKIVIISTVMVVIFVLIVLISLLTFPSECDGQNHHRTSKPPTQL